MALNTANSLIALDEIKTYLNISGADYDTILEQLIDGVSWKFNAYTNRKLKARDLTEYYNGKGRNYLFTREYPINSDKDSIEIYVDSDRDYGAGTKVDADTIIIDSDIGKITLEEDTFVCYPQGTKIVYNAGYSTIPYDLTEACRKQVKYEFLKWKDNREGKNTVNIDAGSITFSEEAMLPEVEQVLKRYKAHGHIYA